jgi:hypothetical protein
MTVQIFRHNKQIKQPEVIIRQIQYRELQVLSEEAYSTLPDNFRCYNCLRLYPKDNIGGIELHQYFCKHCYPYLDEITIGRTIRFDLLHHKPVKEY